MTFWYATTLFVHSWLRWGVLGMAVACAVRARLGWAARRPFGPTDARMLRAFVGLVDTQLLLGLLLYAVLSPIAAAGWQNLSAAMGHAVPRFFAIEHPLAMLIGVVVLHVGLRRAKHRGADARRHQLALRTILAALLCVLIGIPWPGLPYARPLARGAVWGAGATPAVSAPQ